MFSFVLEWGRIQDQSYPLLEINCGQFQKNYPLMRSFNELLAAFFCLVRFVVAACALNGVFVIVILKLLLDLSFGVVSIWRASRTDINFGQFQMHCLNSPDLMRSFTEVFATMVGLIDFVGKAFLMDVAFVLAILKLILDLSMGMLSITIKSVGLLRREHFLLALRCLSF